MADESSVEQPFFIYDHSVLKREEDDIKDAIIYYYPPMTSIDDRCALCGQLMGMVTFFISITGTPPSMYRLFKSKIAVRHQGRFTFAMGADQKVPDRVVIKKLNFALQLFRLFHRDIEDVAKLCEKQNRNFVDYLGIIWDTYIPFTHYYGDDMMSALRPVQTVQLSRGHSTLFLRATNLLEACQKSQGVLAGCILFRNKVLFTQLTASFTSRLLLIRPQQTHLPCRAINTEFIIPNGVRLLAVYITEDEEKTLYPPWYEFEFEEPEPEHFISKLEVTNKNLHRISTEATQSEEDTLSFVSIDGRTPRSTPDFIHSQEDSGASKGKLPPKDTRENDKPHNVCTGELGTPEEIAQIGLQDAGKPPDEDARLYKFAEQIAEAAMESAVILLSMENASEMNSKELPYRVEDTGNQNHKAIKMVERLAEQIVNDALQAAMHDALTTYTTGSALPPTVCHIKENLDDNRGFRPMSQTQPTDISSLAENISLAVLCEAMQIVCSTNRSPVTIMVSASGTVQDGGDRSSVQVVADEISQAVVDCVLISGDTSHHKETDASSSAVDTLAENLTQSVVSSAVNSVVSLKLPTQQLGSISGNNPDDHQVCVNHLVENMVSSIFEDVLPDQSQTDATHSPSFGEPDKLMMYGTTSVEVAGMDSPSSHGIPKRTLSYDKPLNLDLQNTSRTVKQPPTPGSHGKDSTLPLTPLVPVTKTELFKAVKQASRNAVKNYESLTSSESTPQQSPYPGMSRSSSRAPSEVGSYSSDAPTARTRTMSVEDTMKRLVDLTQPVVAAQKSTMLSSPYTAARGVERCHGSSSEGGATGGLDKMEKETPAEEVKESTKVKSKKRKRSMKGSDGFIETDLYVQANNDLLLILVMEGGASQDNDTVQTLWKTGQQQLTELDVYIKERNIGVGKTIKKDTDYNYLCYNESEQTLKGNKLSPVTGSENQFCQSAIAMHDDFCSSEMLTDIALRSQGSFVYGHRSAGQETFFQIHGSARNMAGFPNDKEINMAADAVAFQKMLTEEKALII